MKAQDDDLRLAFEPLFADLQSEDDYPNVRPLLAHYTSVETFEKILKADEIWFSNPLFMNDYQEIRWGMLEGSRLALSDEKIKAACGDAEREKQFMDAFETLFRRFEDKHALDTYILCFSNFKPENGDGLLSMWRGYGGDGGGVAIVIDTGKLNEDNQTLILARVHYASDDERYEWLDALFGRFADLLKAANPPAEKLYCAAHWLFERLKFFAIFSKHSGFGEEQEWRAVYMPWLDEEGKYKDLLSYVVTARGVQPKLKLPVSRIPLAPEDVEKGEQASLERFLHRVILGPTIASPLAKACVDRMLDCIERPAIKEFVSASGIPYRTSY